MVLSQIMVCENKNTRRVPLAKSGVPKCANQAAAYLRSMLKDFYLLPEQKQRKESFLKKLPKTTQQTTCC
jgi:uncharacterized FlgJ-related protein